LSYSGSDIGKNRKGMITPLLKDYTDRMNSPPAEGVIDTLSD
jgi:hypothetical protein